MREYTCHKSWVILALIVHCTFSAKAQCDACQFEVDLVTNGDFENGNFGFTTALEYSPGPIFFCPLCDEYERLSIDVSLSSFEVGSPCIRSIFNHENSLGTQHYLAELHRNRDRYKLTITYLPTQDLSCLN
jgi:hypothetical protein